ncbi:MAG: MotA/TolQ/ExbB proton channel family protein [Thiofilum sp.]|uniref:MotA/TolQ/ExbB proton channel family protein n=1 Tax=Thiofilum sp. TaxID=2212733 RepID=UPI0025FADE40|nr:MotA/TolQ/ExbB proton channel family protein [Thiofilum sp.]MBK8451837.1 MotA/TolQ/ExbB proton channel family protein [Thiofilum sp.]
MFEFFKAGGIVMWPLLLCSVIAMAIIIERFWALRPSKIISAEDIDRARKMAASGKITEPMLEALNNSSIMSKVLATGLASSNAPRHIMKENIEEAGRHAVHGMERYLNALGTIATIAPLLGLLGTVLGMVDVFGSINKAGLGNPALLAGGISEALITTVAGLIVAIPALIFHRYFKGRVDNYVVRMEQEALKLVEITNNNRTNALPPKSASPSATTSAAESALQVARANAARLRGQEA